MIRNMPTKKKSVTSPPRKEDVLTPRIPINALGLRDPRRLAIVLSVIVIAVAAIPSVYFYNQYRTTQSLLSNPSVLGAKEVDELVNRVGKLFELPSGENPTVASVSDVNKLKDQPFFARAQNGDKVLIYTKTQKAILYRPSTDKIVEVGPVNIQPTGSIPSVNQEQPFAQPNISPAITNTITPTLQASPTVEADKKVSILNGSNSNGLTKKVSDRLTQNMQGIVIVNRGNAVKRDYDKTLVIDVNGRSGKKVEEIAKFLNGQVSILPEGEAASTADILIIATE